MASNTNLGGVFTTDIDGQLQSLTFLSTENVCGIIFDTKIVGGITAALVEDSKAYKAFQGGNVVELNYRKDIEKAGIDETVLKGIVKYHLDTFFDLAGDGQRLFVSFMDSTSDADFNAIEKMQLAANGIIYQIGVWTGAPVATVVSGSDKYQDSGLLLKLQRQAEAIGGTIGTVNTDGHAPLNILLNAPVVDASQTDLDKLPDFNALDLPKVSYVLGQPATEEIHKLMYAVNHAVEDEIHYAVVGNIGALMGCYAVAPANESIGHVASFNLARVTTEAELGFGNISDSTETGKSEYASTSSFTNIKTLNYSVRNLKLHKNGYIFLTFYDGLEDSVFFSSDQTLSAGDYRTVARCRVIHKSRRVVRRALLPRVNSNVEVDVTTGMLSASSIAELQTLVISALDANMVEPGTSKPQISGRTCTIDENQDVLSNDKINIDYRLIPLGTASEIHVTEGFTATEGV